MWLCIYTYFSIAFLMLSIDIRKWYLYHIFVRHCANTHPSTVGWGVVSTVSHKKNSTNNINH